MATPHGRARAGARGRAPPRGPAAAGALGLRWAGQRLRRLLPGGGGGGAPPRLVGENLERLEPAELPAVEPAYDAAREAAGPRGAVLVLGAGGELGSKVVSQLLAAGSDVVAACRSREDFEASMQKCGRAPGLQPGAGEGSYLFVRDAVDVCDPATVGPALGGCTQVVLALGARGVEGMTPEMVDKDAVELVVAAASQALAPERLVRTKVASLNAGFAPLDDVIMGGRSRSAMERASTNVGSAGDGATWAGEVVEEGGGFCGARSGPLGLDLADRDGLCVKVRSDSGQRFKMNVKTADLDRPEYAYQATFETSADGFQWVYLPWHAFHPVRMASVAYDSPPLDPSKISTLGLVYSRFNYNGLPEFSVAGGPFQLEVDDGIYSYRKPRPSLVHVSSAGVERNALIRSEEERKADIPIVQLNPGGVLNWKYAGEIAVRSSGLPYAILRPTGLVDGLEGDCLLEASQGDTVSGVLRRDELAAVVVAALSSPDSAGKTLELRRQKGGEGKKMDGNLTRNLFLSGCSDFSRAERGLLPLPPFVPPPPPPSEERVQEIVDQVARERVSRV